MKVLELLSVPKNNQSLAEINEWLFTLVEDFSTTNYGGTHPTFDDQHSHEIGTEDGFTVRASKFVDTVAFGIVKNGNVLAYMCIAKQPIQINGKPYHRVVRERTDSGHRDLGLQAAMYLLILKKLKRNLIGNDKASINGMQIMKKLIADARFDISYYNDVDKTVVNKQPDDLFTPATDWHIMFNSKQ